MNECVLELHGEEATRRLGARLAELLPDGAVVALDGPLGAGKTRLVQGLAAACGIDPQSVVSPTFMLIQEYRGTRNVYHFDVYRLHDEDEFEALGPEEYFSAGGICILEWASKAARCLPDERLEITLIPVDETTRRAVLIARGNVYESVIGRL